MIITPEAPQPFSAQLPFSVADNVLVSGGWRSSDQT